MRHNDELKYIPRLEIVLTGEDGGVMTFVIVRELVREHRQAKGRRP